MFLIYIVNMILLIW